MRIIAVYNIKGGVGKTTTAVNLAYLSAGSGARTLIWDLDPQGAATFCFRVRPRIKGGLKKLFGGRKPIERFIRGTDFEGLDLLPSDFSYRNLDLALDSSMRPKKRLGRIVRPLDGDYDHVWLDCAPGISLASEGIFRAADVLLVPTIPTTLALRTLEQLGSHLERKGPERLTVLPFFTMVDRRKSLQRKIVERREAGPFPFLESTVPYASVVERMGHERNPLFEYAPRSDAAQAYERLWHELMDRTGSLLGRISRPPRGSSRQDLGDDSRLS